MDPIRRNLVTPTPANLFEKGDEVMKMRDEFSENREDFRAVLDGRMLIAGRDVRLDNVEEHGENDNLIY
jgi:hypothetical protein